MERETKIETGQIAQWLDRPIVLVGMMGSGKTRLGRKLADALALEFYDSDQIIQEKAGCTINEIFKQDGEGKFRDVERKTILALLDKGPCVIASGGGSLTSDETMLAVKAKSLSVWLKADIADLAARLAQAHDRPLLKAGRPEDVLRALAEGRVPLYAQADITIETGGLTPQDAGARLIKGLYGFLKPGNL